ncbi:MAG: inositol monophosphatase family protein, partial [Alphaproteobacteria bacterium]
MPQGKTAPRSADINVMMRAAYAAAKGLQRDFGEVIALQASPKGSDSFVVESRRKATGLLKGSLTQARPQFSWLSAEVKGRPGRWLVDAINGNRNFAHGLPFFAVVIAIQFEGEITSAVIFDPLRDELFRASRGDGAYWNDRRLRVSSRRELSEALIGIDSVAPRADEDSGPRLAALRAQRSQIVNTTAGARELGCGALDLA